MSEIALGTVSSKDRKFVSINDVIEFWRGEKAEWVAAHFIGWGEPFCFACWWLPPVRDGAPGCWETAGRWLDKAHLQDHVVAGDDSPSNLVMLCHLCHDDMPEFDDRSAAIEWVKSHAHAPMMWQMFTDQHGFGITVSRRTMHRFRGVYNKILVETIRGHDHEPGAVEFGLTQSW